MYASPNVTKDAEIQMLFLPNTFLSDQREWSGQLPQGGGYKTVNYEETQTKSYGPIVAEGELEPGMGYELTSIIGQRDVIIKNPQELAFYPSSAILLTVWSWAVYLIFFMPPFSFN